MRFTYDGKEFYIHNYLALQLQSMVCNLKHDHDFMILITGNRMVRVGKSVLAITVCCFLNYLLERTKSKGRPMNTRAFTIDDIYFEGKEISEKALNKPKYCVNLYDEGREGLAANKAMTQVQQDLVDFYTECGQLNHIFVVVAPDFFELKEYIAVARSQCLINVYLESDKVMKDVWGTGKLLPITMYRRGHFQFFGPKGKQILYDKYRTTRMKSYRMVRHDFVGDFSNQYPIDEEGYKQKKKDALGRFKEKHKKEEDAIRLTVPLRFAIVAYNNMTLEQRKELLFKAGVDNHTFTHSMNALTEKYKEKYGVCGV